MVVTYLVARACDRDWPDGLSVVKAWLDGHHPDEKYLRQPIVDLNVLRLLCEQWRAIAPSGVLARLFHGPLPKELFVHVLSFWRSARALDEDRGGDRQRLLALPPPWSTGG